MIKVGGSFEGPALREGQAGKMHLSETQHPCGRIVLASFHPPPSRPPPSILSKLDRRCRSRRRS